MPKINYNLSEWPIQKRCGYCGKVFYPKTDECFCRDICVTAYENYMDDIEMYMLQEWLEKSWEER